jgi:hypothetical protein
MKKSVLSALLFATILAPGLVFASESTWTRNIGCMASGPTGVNAVGTYTLVYETASDGTVAVKRSEVAFTNFQFVTDRIPGSKIENLSATTEENGDGDDTWYSNYTQTSSPRIERISLTLTGENEEQVDSFVITSKGNRYWMACSVNGASG